MPLGSFRLNGIARKQGIAGSAESSWNSDSITYDNVSYSVADRITLPNGLTFSNNGQYFYVSHASVATIYQYTCATPWNVSTASFTRSQAITQTSAIHNMQWKPDGTAFYLMGGTTDNWILVEYSCSTPWNINTLSFVRSSNVLNQQGGAFISGFNFSPNGSKFISVNRDADAIYEWSLSTAWNISTLSYTGSSFDISALTGNARAIIYKQDGTKIAILESSADGISFLTLSTPFSLSTASYSSVKTGLTQETNAYGLYISPEGTKLYITGRTMDTIFQYSMT